MGRWKRFGGTNKDGRVSLGSATIEGFPPKIIGKNIWGGKNASKKVEFKGKCSGIISVDGTLYAWINLHNSKMPDSQLAWSSDFGKTWTKATWIFPVDGPFFPNSFLNFEKDYNGSRDNYVYMYGNDRRGKNRPLFLARVLRQKLKNRDAYEFFSTLDSNNQPVWVSDINRRGPVAIDPDGIGATASVYNPKVNRYLLTTHHGNYVGRFGLFDAPEPWGPWTTVAYYNDWIGLGKVEAGMPHTFPTKWISDDGKTMWMVFSGTGMYDSFNMIKVMLVMQE